MHLTFRFNSVVVRVDTKINCVCVFLMLLVLRNVGVSYAVKFSMEILFQGYLGSLHCVIK